jgi:hypothetical protein
MQYKNEVKGNQAYEKPRLRVIELAAEEVLGAGCKINASSNAKIGQFLRGCSLTSNCRNSGGS